jgi:uncharacterized protein (TIGR02246 family)
MTILADDPERNLTLAQSDDPNLPHLEQVGRNWVAGWNSRDSKAFSRLFTPDGEYADPSFGVRRTGRTLLRMHHALWRNAVPDFVMTVRHIHVAARSVIVEVTAEGTFSGGDLGGGKMKATKMAFRGWMIAVLEVNEAGEIMVCRDYYDRSLVPGGAQPPFDALRP